MTHDRTATTDPRTTAASRPAATVEPYVTAGDVAAFLGLPENSVYKLALRRQLPSYKLGKSRRFRLSEVAAVMAAGRVEGGADA